MSDDCLFVSGGIFIFVVVFGWRGGSAAADGGSSGSSVNSGLCCFCFLKEGEELLGMGRCMEKLQLLSGGEGDVTNDIFVVELCVCICLFFSGLLAAAAPAVTASVTLD